jgi:diguanylate cyclase (GGDEF)-like protein
MNNKNILIVDDSKTICAKLENKIKEELGLNPIIASSKKECAERLLEYKGKIDVALLDLGLPDAPNGEVVSFVTKFNIPTIVLTGQEDKEDQFRNMDIMDYVIKDSSFSFEYIISLVKRIISNKDKTILVVDDSRTMGNIIIDLLNRYQINTLYAQDGVEALKVLKENKNITMIYTDYNMPNMDGLELVKNIRREYSKDELNITTITDNKDNHLIAKFLKYGSNDFLYKGFSKEEFYARLNSSLEILDLFEDIKNKANKDFLTGAYNRRYFFQEGLKKFNKHDNVKLFMIDIDKFKNINDTYGHDIGDIAIKEVIKIVNEKLKDKDCILSRFGGEEFCTMVFDEDEKDFLILLENIRAAFESNVIKTEKGDISYTVSIGYCAEKLNTIDEMIISSDKGLYKAKESGRNQVRN